MSGGGFLGMFDTGNHPISREGTESKSGHVTPISMKDEVS